MPNLKENLSEFQLSKYHSIMQKQASQASYHDSLFVLSKLLYESYNEKIIILIDEYDSPIHAGYNCGYYNEVIQFMRSFLTSVLKDNDYLEKGILTGILQTAKEGIFSGLNNLQVYSLINPVFQDKFGFTESEVTQLFKERNLLGILDKAQQWYNGYMFGINTVYNPWSILICVNQDGALQPYWVNTSDNQLIKKLLASSVEEIKFDFELLLSDNIIKKEIDGAVVFPGIENNPIAIWSLLLFTGYLTYTSCELQEGIQICNLKIPNKEIKLLYNSFIKDIFRNSLRTDTIDSFLKALVPGDIETFAYLLQEFVINSLSMYDLPSNEPEKSYHLFVLGLLVLLKDSYIVKSNRESGYGRYDIMLIPKDKSKLGIIIEFKKVPAYTNLKNCKGALEEAAQKALKQINEKQYAQELKNLGITHIKALGIAFCGKELLVVEQHHD